MDMHSKHELTEVVAPRYHKATKKEKGCILSEYCKNTGYDRKYAIKKLKREHLYPRKQSRKKEKRRAPPSRYRLIKASIIQFWKATNYPSAVRLHAMIPLLLAKNHQFGEVAITKEQENLLNQISTASLGRMLVTERRKRRRAINSHTKPGTIKSGIPFACDVAKRTTPGYLEIDLVAHCGEHAMGHFLYTLSVTDFATGWHENEAIMGKSQHVVVEALQRIQERLPFPLRGIDSDNGTEFINAHLERFTKEHKLEFTRSRPYRKNDNAHIEQKNWTNVRKLTGYYRLDTPQEQEALNELYRNELRLFINYFMPSQKLISKERHGSKIKKKHDKPQTPYARACKDPAISQEAKAALHETYELLNPFELKRSIDKKILAIQYFVCNNTKGTA